MYGSFKNHKKSDLFNKQIAALGDIVGHKALSDKAPKKAKKQDSEKIFIKSKKKPKSKK